MNSKICGFGTGVARTIQQYEIAANDVVETLVDPDDDPKVIIAAYDTELLEFNRDWRDYSDNETLSASCYDVLTKLRRAAATTGESLVIAVSIVYNSKCLPQRRPISPIRPIRPLPTLIRPNRPNFTLLRGP